MKKECHIIISIHLDLLAHLKVMINFEIKPSFKFLLINSGFFGHESFVLEVSYIASFHHVCKQFEFVLYSFLYFF